MKAQTSSTTSLAISSGLFTAVIAILNLKVELFRSTHSFTLLAGFLCAIETVLFLIAFSDLKDIFGFENCGWLEVIGSIVHPVCTTTSYLSFIFYLIRVIFSGFMIYYILTCSESIYANSSKQSNVKSYKKRN